MLDKNIVFYQTNPNYLFGGNSPLRDKDANGFYNSCYKVFCIDIDGFNGVIEPFGYGINLEGKIINGLHANE